MGGCVSHDRENQAQRRRRRRRRSHSARSSGTSKLLIDIISLSILFAVLDLASGTVGRNKPLNRSACRPKWKSDIPITENQLRRKREEYWDTGEFPSNEQIEFHRSKRRKLLHFTLEYIIQKIIINAIFPFK